MDKLNKLRELHDEIKLHPFRDDNDKKYWPDYRDKLYDLSHAFWEVWEERYPWKTFPGRSTSGFIHDFNAAILYRHIPHIERCVQYIHRYLDTGELTSYATYYTGCNIHPSLNRLRIHNWDEARQQYVSQYTVDELTDLLKDNPKKVAYREYYLKKYKELTGQDYEPICP